jgi:hypothetical protein
VPLFAKLAAIFYDGFGSKAVVLTGAKGFHITPALAYVYVIDFKVRRLYQ